MMQRTKHLSDPKYTKIVQAAQDEVDRRFEILKKREDDQI